MATKTTAPVPTGMDHTLTKLDIVGKSVEDAFRNVRSGPVRVYGIEIDNMVVSSNAPLWVKLYNVVDNAFVAGTSKPLLVFPLAIVSADPLTEGHLSIYIPGGVPFSNGVSVLASKENGDTMTDAPASDCDVYLVTD